jgi:hypothetical protein
MGYKMSWTSRRKLYITVLTPKQEKWVALTPPKILQGNNNHLWMEVVEE